MTQNEYAEKIKYYYNLYSGSYNQSNYNSMRKIVLDNIDDYEAGLIEHELLKQLCKVWQAMRPRTCSAGLNAKYKAVLAHLSQFME